MMIGDFKKWIKTAFIAVVIAAIALALPGCSGAKEKETSVEKESTTEVYEPTAEEQMAIDNVKRILANLKDPVSIQLFGDFLTIAVDMSEEQIYMYIDYSAANELGGRVRTTAVFMNGDYLGPYDPQAGLHTFRKDLTAEGRIHMSTAETLMEIMEMSGDPTDSDYITNVTYISGEKVSQNLHVAWFDF